MRSSSLVRGQQTLQQLSQQVDGDQADHQRGRRGEQRPQGETANKFVKADVMSDMDSTPFRIQSRQEKHTGKRRKSQRRRISVPFQDK